MAGAHGTATDFLEKLAETIQRQDFDHPFTVHPDGTVTDAPAGIYAPEVWHDDTLDVDGYDRSSWEALTGMTGQHAYNGAVMHSSEYINCCVAERMCGELAGTFVLVVVEVLPEDDDPEPEPAGWAIMRRIGEGA